MGRAKMVAGYSEAALSDMREAAKLEPGLPALQLDIGNVLRDRGEVEGALEAYKAAVDVDLDDESPRALAGLCHLQLGDPRAAERAFDAAIGISPEYALAWFGKGRALMARGRHKRAVRYLREALRIDRHMTMARLSLAEAYLVLGMTGEAEVEVRRSYALDPGAADAVDMLEALGARVPGPPGPEPVEEEGPRPPLATEPPRDAPPGVPAAEEAQETDQLEEPPSPGPNLERWFEEHRELPPLEEEEERKMPPAS
jgi:tetratricopeptide (TPR) repeat protein